MRARRRGGGWWLPFGAVALRRQQAHRRDAEAVEGLDPQPAAAHGDLAESLVTTTGAVLVALPAVALAVGAVLLLVDPRRPPRGGRRGRRR